MIQNARHLFYRSSPSPGRLTQLLALLLILLTGNLQAQQVKEPFAEELKNLSIDELLDVEVTIVSRSPQKLSEAASAVQVITAEDIRNSGANNIAEALRLVSNLQTAQLNAGAWLISARGFNTVFANKLLVMIDGRSVYTPLFAGVFWDMQNVVLEDIERIEVVSGPGGTLWGANAVNGVINIVTKNSKDTHGLYADVLAGTLVKDQFSVRWGDSIGKNVSYRVYGQHFDRSSTLQPDGKDHHDAWRLSQAGFRIDGHDNKSNLFTLQGDLYAGVTKTTPDHSRFNGQNLLGRWSRAISDLSDLSLQVYYDRYFKSDRPGLIADEVTTVDVDFQYRVPLAAKQSLLAGAGYRVVKDEFKASGEITAILPATKRLDLFNCFIQDEITLSRRLKLTAGTKLLHNVYTGFEWQPGIRAAYALRGENTLWASVSRSVRTPSRIDVDYYSPLNAPPPGVATIRGGPDFISEKAYAFESGYRTHPNKKSSFAVALFYNLYRDVYSLEPLPGTAVLQTMNGTEGSSWGTELSGTYQLASFWRVRGGYTYFNSDLKAKKGHNFDPSYLANDVQHQVLIQSMTDLPLNFHLDIIARYLDHLPQTLATEAIPRYIGMDGRLAYRRKAVEISVAGQNLLQKKHKEFGNLYIPRSVYAKLAVRL